MVTALERNDPLSPRIRTYRPRFLAAPPPDPNVGDWSSWERLLGTRDHDNDIDARGALFIDPVAIEGGGLFGTTSSSLLALPAMERTERRPVFRFASGPPESWRWEEIAPP